jgi:hypothetical protein
MYHDSMGWKNHCHDVQLLNTIDTNKIKRMKAIPSVDFNPHDDLILDLLNDSRKHVYHIVMASGEEKWFLELDYVNMGKPVTIYFDVNDSKVFKEKVGQSLKEQKGEGFNPKNTILNPYGIPTTQTKGKLAYCAR